MKFHCFFSTTTGYVAIPIYHGKLSEPLPEGQPFQAYNGEGEYVQVTAGPHLGKSLPFSRLPDAMRAKILDRIDPAG